MLSSTHRQRLLPLVCLGVLALAISGCGLFSPDETRDDGGPGEVVQPYEDATTPDILINNFVRAYEERNFAQYSKLIHDEFQFFFWEEDVVKLGLDAPGWDRVAELGATENMFEGNPGIDIDDEPVPGIVKIAMTKQNDTVAAWVPSQGEPLFDETLVRRYRFNIDVTHDGVSTQVQVRGIQEFYAAQVEIDGKQLFQIKFWKDLGTNLGG